MKSVYLDNGATTMVDPKVVKAVSPYFSEIYGNPSSQHSFGYKAKEALEEAREIIAKSINANAEEIIFTSGGTESNNLALKSIAFTNRDKGNHIIVSKVDHKCVINAAKWLEKQGFDITYLEVDNEGVVDPKKLETAITEKTILVSVIHANNEIGTIQDLSALADVCRKYNVYFHTDACQSFTKATLDVKKQAVDLITLNAHKMHGPKGIGALYIRKGTKIKAWQHGGGHEFDKRSGTENIQGAVGFAAAVKIAKKDDVLKMVKLRDKLIDGLLKISKTRLNGPSGDKRLCNSVNISFYGVEGEAIGGYLDGEGICSSTGSACSEASLEPSYVLRGIGLNHQEANGSLRLTLSKFTTSEDIDYVLKVLPGIIKKLRDMSPIGR